MTGYASVSTDTAIGRVSLELRSINSRYLDVGFRLADELRSIEPSMRELILAHLGRGKLECRASVARRVEAAPEIRLNRALVRSLAKAATEVADDVSDLEPLSAIDVLRWPGVVEEADVDSAALWDQIRPLAEEALTELVASRRREGARLRTEIESRAARMASVVDALKQRAPELVAEYQQRLVERLQEAASVAFEGAAVPVDETMARIRQEVSLYGLRIDVAEELSRLRIHVDELLRVLAAGGAVGKRLDFMMQELNREANTLASKAANVDLTNASVELKLLIEQIREQVQNLE